MKVVTLFLILVILISSCTVSLPLRSSKKVEKSMTLNNNDMSKIYRYYKYYQRVIWKENKEKDKKAFRKWLISFIIGYGIFDYLDHTVRKKPLYP